jgi:hypothetical protein
LKRAIEKAAQQALQQTPLGIAQAVGSLFLSLASATGNEFAIWSINNLNERLRCSESGKSKISGCRERSKDINKCLGREPPEEHAAGSKPIICGELTGRKAILSDQSSSTI